MSLEDCLEKCDKDIAGAVGEGKYALCKSYDPKECRNYPNPFN